VSQALASPPLSYLHPADRRDRRYYKMSMMKVSSGI
jgi:hypothetical protein